MVSSNPFNAPTRRGVWLFLAVALACFNLEPINLPLAIKVFALWPPAGTGDFAAYQVVTYAWLHGGVLHISLNLFMFWMFGRGIEAVWGTTRLWMLLVGGSVAAAVAHIACSSIGWTPADPIIGASGAIAAILGAFAVLFPRANVLWLLPPIPMRIWVAVACLALLELALLVTGTWSFIAHDAHLAGFFFGALTAAACRVTQTRVA